MRLLFAALALSLTALAAAADTPRPETVDDTLDLLHAAIREAGFDAARIDRADQSISTAPGTGGGMVVYPDNIHRALQTAGSDAERQAMLDNFIAAMLTPQTAPEAEPLPVDRILPVVRHRDLGLPPGMDMPPLSDPFVGDMVVMYVVDHPSHVAYLTGNDLDAAGLSRADMTDIAFINFDRYGATVQLHSTPPVHMLVLDGFYEASFLLRPDFWPQLEAMLEIDLAVIAPARDMLVIADATDPVALDSLRRIRDDALANGAYPLSEDLLFWRDGAWRTEP
ncbi:MAG: hypothetical protein HLUCCA08_15620 [Rhodobacteraceae bacterium HLUCCA08]|nr:MAG: hypothetical protein HLUCCA08_15620 [Rhodobacteraceae bacterium HLUCCA08]